MSEQSTSTAISSWARRYIETFNLALVPIDPGEKAPKGMGWNKPGGYITDPAAAETFWQRNPNHNLGVVLGPSRVCSLDVDDVQWTRFVLFDQMGLDLDAMAVVYPTIVGNPLRFRVLFKMPDDIDLTRHSLSWPNEKDPDGSIHKALMTRAKASKEQGDAAGEAAAKAEAEEYKRFTVFELRAGLVQDVFPPSIHPGTGKPYTWRTPPNAADGLPVLTTELLNIWQNWDVFKRNAEAACPWAPKPKKPAAKPIKRAPPADGKPSVIDEFNRCHDVEELLRAHDYIKRGNKWLYPHSSTGLPGVTVTDRKVYSHHGADPLANGHQNDAFEVFCLLDHDGDQSKAVKDAARMLGMQHSSRLDPQDLPPAPSLNTGVQDVADESGEAAPAIEGVGESAWSPDKVFQRFALIEGKTSVFDMFRRVAIKKSAFELFVTKVLAKEWFDREDKKCIADEQAKRLEDQARLAGKSKKEGPVGMLAIDRYVYLDGSQDIWDKQLRNRLPAAAVKLALGDAFSLWVNSPERRVIPSANLIFDPCMKLDPALHINTFEGLPLTPSESSENCKAITYLIKFLCNGDQAAMHWLTCWLAYPLQNVGAKLDTALLLHSTMEGSGKSLLLSDIMRPIYGDYGATVGQAQLESSWSQWQANKLYGVFEEVVSRDQRYNQVGKIKHMVTGKTVRIESKFINGWEEANYMNAVFLSNEMMPWPIGENDRRMLVLWPKESLPEKVQKRITWELANDGVAAFYQYLLDYDTGDFDQRTRPPNTDARQWLVDVSRSTWETFLVQWRTGLLGVPFDVALTSDVHDLFKEWCSVNGEHSMSATKFSLFISKHVDKPKGQIHWMDDTCTRRFSIFFLAAPASNLDLSDAREMGRMVSTFRRKAHESGWSPGKWDKCKGWVEPFRGAAAQSG
ncbi:bifunctional DNA primase/polymerase [Pseudomonas sp. Env-44]|uniref:bifunctional DNA primase/polymerase n=1 Tax=unclassified Pseudomonas TaxID=196821 RepID=UPI003521FD55